MKQKFETIEAIKKKLQGLMKLLSLFFPPGALALGLMLALLLADVSMAQQALRGPAPTKATLGLVPSELITTPAPDGSLNTARRGAPGVAGKLPGRRLGWWRRRRNRQYPRTTTTRSRHHLQ
jgi:hypothetical protein